MISFAGAAFLVAACGNGPGSGVQNTPASVGVISVGSGKPLNAKPTPAGITVERIDRRLQGFRAWRSLTDRAARSAAWPSARRAKTR
jgi:hypothetical protein